MPPGPLAYSVVLTERWRLVNSDGQYLYDIQADPAQRKNVASEHPGVVERLRGLYDPFWERVASVIGHLPDDQHSKVMTLKELVSLFKEVGYEVVEQKKFMLSPVGIPLEILIENVVRVLRLGFLFANQLVVGRN